MIYLARTRSKLEFKTSQELKKRGISVYCAKRLCLYRDKKRNLIAEDKPAIDNYLFIDLIPYQFHELQSRPIKHLQIKPDALTRLGERELEDFMARQRKAYSDAQCIYQNGSRTEQAEYIKGQRVQVLEGHLAGVVLEFESMLSPAHAPHPKIKATGPFGSVELDPLNVKALDE